MPASAAFDADHPHILVVQECVKQSDRIAPAADAGDQRVRQPFLLLQNLPPRLASDHALKIAHHHRIRMRAEHAAEDVMGACGRWSPSRASPR